MKQDINELESLIVSYNACNKIIGKPVMSFKCKSAAGKLFRLTRWIVNEIWNLYDEKILLILDNCKWILFTFRRNVKKYSLLWNLPCRKNLFSLSYSKFKLKETDKEIIHFLRRKKILFFHNLIGRSKKFIYFFIAF